MPNTIHQGSGSLLFLPALQVLVRASGHGRHRLLPALVLAGGWSPPCPRFLGRRLARIGLLVSCRLIHGPFYGRGPGLRPLRRTAYRRRNLRRFDPRRGLAQLFECIVRDFGGHVFFQRFFRHTISRSRLLEDLALRRGLGRRLVPVSTTLPEHWAGG